MPASLQGRRAFQLENDRVRVSVLVGGGHIAEILLKEKQVNPLWIPPWPSMEPCDFDAQVHTEYGNDAESRLLAGIMGHNLCFDFYGPPSEEEAACGLTVHGEASVINWEMEAVGEGELRATAELPLAEMRLERRFRLSAKDTVVTITETAENLSAADRAVGWTQHVTLGPPFLAPGRTVFHMPVTRSKAYESDFAEGKGTMQPGAEFDWPWCPDIHGGRIDLRQTSAAPVSAGFTAHLMDPAKEQAWFTAYNPDIGVLFGYAWRRSDFPWLGIWEENHCRQHRPWNGRTLTRAMEFGVSPMPEPRRRMIDRKWMFGAPCYRWIPARTHVTVEYSAFIRSSDQAVREVAWQGEGVVLR
ncbi:MAG: hypothetical protein HY236_01835 [Acidobacteria bacterium]|nr:hypothetical protein [Acidobacteriota bacterium]